MKQSKKTIHLICNAHLDPVWLWQREEGIAEALSTFRVAAKDGDMPLFVWNPHPYPVNTIIECEMQLADQNQTVTFFDIEVFNGNKKMLSQIEQEASNFNLDWRKKVVFKAELAPSSITRYECCPKEMEKKPIFLQLKRNLLL